MTSTQVAGAAGMAPGIQLGDFVGEHGSYQLSITVFLFVRYAFLGLMANSGPLMTPDVTFYCQLPMDEIVAIMPNISQLSGQEREQEIKEELKRICQLDLRLYNKQTLNNGNNNQFNSNSSKTTNYLNPPRQVNSSGSSLMPNLAAYSGMRNMGAGGGGSSDQLGSELVRECTDFTYEIAPDQGRTMTSEFDLVCERDGLRSLFQSLLSASIVVAHVFWGTFSDKYGRFKAQKLCLLVSLIAGGFSIFATDFWTFLLTRALCSFGDLGLVVSLTTTVVELVGHRYRGLSVAIVNFGYALGVTILPYIVAYFEDFRKVIALTVLCHLCSIPFIFTTNESVRWLLTNRRFQLAKKEIRRIMRWNKKAATLRRRLCLCFYFNSPSPSLPASKRSLPLISSLFSTNNNNNNNNNSGVNSQNTEEGVSLNEKLNQKREFDLLFSKFIDQIESQNFCDPLNSSFCQELSSTAGACQASSSSSSTDEQPLTQQQQPQARQDLKQSDLVQDESPFQSKTNSSYSLDQGVLRSFAKKDEVIQFDLDQELQVLQEDELSSEKNSPDDDTFKRSIMIGHDRRGLSASVCWLNKCQLAGRSDVLAESKESAFDESKRTVSCGRLDSLKKAALKVNSTNQVLKKENSSSWGRQLGNHIPARQADCINLVAHQLSFVGRVNRLFRDKQLMIVVFTIVWTTFNSELQYTSFIIINLEVGEDVYLNYILGGCMEALAAIIASILLSYAPRRHTLITFWLMISLSCFGLSVAHIDSTWAVWLLALAKFFQSSLSSVASVAAYESFPTFLRQSGSGLVFTLGMMGSVFAPLIFAEFDDHDGMDRVLMTFSLSSLTAAILIYLYLRETKDCELN